MRRQRHAGFRRTSVGSGRSCTTPDVDGQVDHSRTLRRTRDRAASKEASEAPDEGLRFAREGPNGRGEEVQRQRPDADKRHARNAKARAPQQRDAGNLTTSEKRRIDRKADKIRHDD